MSEQVIRRQQEMNRSKLRTLVQVGMLGAVAGVLMNFEFPIPVLAPPFYQMDFSEIPVLVGTFAMGPVAGMLIELIKILLHFVLHGSTTAGVGEFANFVMGCAFLIPAGMIYRYHHRKTRTHALVGMAAGTICMTVVACFVNVFVMLPLYGKAFGMPVEAFVEMGTAVQGVVHNLFTFAVFIIAPFNLFKGIVISVIVTLIYKRIRVVLRGD